MALEADQTHNQACGCGLCTEQHHTLRRWPPLLASYPGDPQARSLQACIHHRCSQRPTSLSAGRGSFAGRKVEEMNRRNNGKRPKLDLRLNLSPPPRRNPSRPTVDDVSPVGSPRSCVSSENEQELKCSNSPEATSMVLAGCPRCLMYVMLSEDQTKCPRCRSPVLLDFHLDTKKTKKS